MELIFNIVSIFSVSFYSIYIYFFYRGLNKNHNNTSKCDAKVSVVIPARNEEKNILVLLNSLNSQNFDKNKFEVIVVDDFSTDNTFKIASDFCQTNSNFRIIQNESYDKKYSPKVMAQSKGVMNSKNEIIFMTDADCELNQNWISSVLKQFDDNTAIVTGVTLFKNNKNNFFHTIQQLDYSSHNAICAGSLGNDLIVNANGTNLAIRKSALEEVGGILKVSKYFSGEDSFLAQLFTNTKWKVKFTFDNDSIVKTNFVNNWSEYFNQRIRWSAQTLNYPLPIKIFLYNTAILHFVLIFLILSSIIKFNLLLPIIFINKSLIDFVFLKKYFKNINTKINFNYFILSELFHLPTTIYIAFKAYFISFKWKE